jgi:hypothetical protein
VATPDFLTGDVDFTLETPAGRAEQEEFLQG